MKSIIAIFVVLALSTSAFGQIAGSRAMPENFRSDNCTLFPDGNYADCCVAHDKDYYFGGSLKERKASDKRLRECVRAKGKGWTRRFLANGMYLGVRLFGVPFLPTPFRWGFGANWPRQRIKKARLKMPGTEFTQ